MASVVAAIIFLLVGQARKGKAAAVTNSTNCDATCLAGINLAASWETSQHAEPEYDFYTVPSNFSEDLSPGSILRVEQTTDLVNYTVPSGLTMSRIIYTTEDVDGRILPASAYIIWPYAPLATGSKNDGMPMVAWAHGTSGVLANCAPSNYRNLQYHFMVPFALALQGMVVVAPDYAGLGVSRLPSGEEIRHPWITSPAQANDLANAVIAARTAFPDSLNQCGSFVAMGHSQGGGAAWALAERMVDRPIKGYKGTVAIAPATRTMEVLKSALADPTLPYSAGVLGFQPVLISAVTALEPSYNLSGLTPRSYDRWRNVYEPLQACLPTYGVAFAGFGLEDFARADWVHDDAALRYAKVSQAGGRKFKGPLLVIDGANDHVVPEEFVQATVNDTCEVLKKTKSTESLSVVSFSGVDHFPVIQASQSKWMSWVKERLTGSKKDIKRGCVKSSVTGFQTEKTVQGPFPNFLVQAASGPEEAWKYLL